MKGPLDVPILQIDCDRPIRLGEQFRADSLTVEPVRELMTEPGLQLGDVLDRLRILPADVSSHGAETVLDRTNLNSMCTESLSDR